LNRCHEALDACRRAIKLAPNPTEAHNNLGVAYFELSQHSEAVESFKQAVALEREIPESHNNLGYVYGSVSVQRNAHLLIDAYLHIVSCDSNGKALYTTVSWGADYGASHHIEL